MWNTTSAIVIGGEHCLEGDLQGKEIGTPIYSMVHRGLDYHLHDQCCNCTRGNTFTIEINRLQ